MNHKKIHKKILILEKEYKILKRDLDNQQLLKSIKDNYLSSDKEEFKKLWDRYIKFFEKFKKILRLCYFKIEMSPFLLK